MQLTAKQVDRAVKILTAHRGKCLMECAYAISDRRGMDYAIEVTRELARRHVIAFDRRHGHFYLSAISRCVTCKWDLATTSHNHTQWTILTHARQDHLYSAV